MTYEIKWSHQGAREEGDLRIPKYDPRGLWMLPNNDNIPIATTWMTEDIYHYHYHTVPKPHISKEGTGKEQSVKSAPAKYISWSIVLCQTREDTDI